MRGLFFTLLILRSVVCFSQNIDKPTVLFVCEHGAAKSTIAAAYFNKIAIEKGLDYQAVFRGTNPEEKLTSGSKQGLIKDGFDITKMEPCLVSKNDVAKADQIITFDCTLPDDYKTTDLQHWNGVTPVSENYDKARDQIIVRVDSLINQLLKNKK